MTKSCEAEIMHDALVFARRLGWKVFPIKRNTKNIPLVKWGTAASSDYEQVRRQWLRHPGSNIGLSCGASGLTVIDIDTKNGKRGQTTVDLLELVDGCRFTPTKTQRTPSGGLQMFYKGTVATTQNVIGKHLWPDGISHIDTRSAGGAGGYCLLPPSRTVGNSKTHTSAGVYEWINDRGIAPLDEWVVDVMAAYAATRGAPVLHDVFVGEEDSDEEIKWYEHYLAHDAQIAVEGEGGELLTLTQIAAVAKDHGLSMETALDKAYSSLWNDFCDPPWPYDELERKFANAYEYCKDNAPGSKTAAYEFAEPIDAETRVFLAKEEAKANIRRDPFRNVPVDPDIARDIPEQR